MNWCQWLPGIMEKDIFINAIMCGMLWRVIINSYVEHAQLIGKSCKNIGTVFYWNTFIPACEVSYTAIQVHLNTSQSQTLNSYRWPCLPQPPLVLAKVLTLALLFSLQLTASAPLSASKPVRYFHNPLPGTPDHCPITRFISTISWKSTPQAPSCVTPKDIPDTACSCF